jgi:hypothetical protein
MPDRARPGHNAPTAVDRGARIAGRPGCRRASQWQTQTATQGCGRVYRAATSTSTLSPHPRSTAAQLDEIEPGRGAGDAGAAIRVEGAHRAWCSAQPVSGRREPHEQRHQAGESWRELRELAQGETRGRLAGMRKTMASAPCHPPPLIGVARREPFSPFRLCLQDPSLDPREEGGTHRRLEMEKEPIRRAYPGCDTGCLHRAFLWPPLGSACGRPGWSWTKGHVAQPVPLIYETVRCEGHRPQHQRERTWGG